MAGPETGDTSERPSEKPKDARQQLLDLKKRVDAIPDAQLINEVNVLHAQVQKIFKETTAGTTISAEQKLAIQTLETEADKLAVPKARPAAAQEGSRMEQVSNRVSDIIDKMQKSMGTFGSETIKQICEMLKDSKFFKTILEGVANSPAARIGFVRKEYDKRGLAKPAEDAQDEAHAKAMGGSEGKLKASYRTAAQSIRKKANAEKAAKNTDKENELNASATELESKAGDRYLFENLVRETLDQNNPVPATMRELATKFAAQCTQNEKKATDEAARLTSAPTAPATTPPATTTTTPATTPPATPPR